MLRVLGAAQKREVKATQNLSIIVLFFMICWLPLYTVNCIKAFCQDCEVDAALMLALIALSHVNSAVNPLLYAYHLRDFRAALKNLILRMMGRPVPRTTEVHRRTSAAAVASRLQSMREKRFHPRVYIDSPVWLRQQQVQGKSEVMLTGSISSALRSVVRVASTPTDAGNAEMMSQIAEVPSQAERESSKNLNLQENNNNNSSSFSRMVDLVRGSNSHHRQSSYDYDYGSDEEEEDQEDEGIRITIKHKDRLNLNRSRRRVETSNSRSRRKGELDSISSSSSSDDDVFVTTSSPPPSLNSLDAPMGGGGINNSHLTDLPTFHSHVNSTNQSSSRDESRLFYELYKNRTKKKLSGKEEKVTVRDNKECCGGSSSGTISSEDLTEFRDRSASSVFIIENESVQLSPRRNKLDDEKFFSSPTRISRRRRTSKRQQQKERRMSARDLLIKKPSPLKVVTQLIFASGKEGGNPPSAGVNGKFSYMDMDGEADKGGGKSPVRRKAQTPSV